MSMIPVTISDISISRVGFVVLLKSQQDDRTLPIFIGVPEAQAIAVHLNGVKPPRPLTHDLAKSVLDVLAARLERVEVHDLKEGTFYGRLVLVSEGQTLEVDSRPSDALALALRCNAPVLVASQVMDEAAVMMDRGKAPEPKGVPPDAGPAVADPVARLKGELARAVADERYEDAARLRDAIAKAGRTN